MLIAAALPGLARLELRTDGNALVPEDAPEVRADRDIRERFRVRDVTALVVRSAHPDGIFNVETLDRVRRLSTAAGELAGVGPGDISSLATEPGLRRRAGSLKFRNLIETLPQTPGDLAELREDLRRIELYDGVLIARDGSAAAVLVGAPLREDRAAFVAELEALAATERGGSDQIEVLGAPVAEALLGRHLLADLGLPGAAAPSAAIARRGLPLVPLALLVMATVFWIAFRRPAAVALPLAEAGSAIVLVFGVMGWLGVPITLVSAVLPILLTAVGTADEIHIFRRYLELDPAAAAHPAAHREVIARALRDMAPPVLRTSLTTAAAFLSFAVSPLAAVRDFGLFTALGVMICLLFSWTVVPAVLALAGPRPWVRHVPRASPAEGRFERLARSLAARRRRILGATIVLVALASLGVARLTIEDGWIDGFAPESPFARSTRQFDDAFLGSISLRVALIAPVPELTGEVAESDLGNRHLSLARTAVETPEHLIESWIRIFELDGEKPREWKTWIESVRMEEGTVVLEMARRGGSARFWLRPSAGQRIGYEIRAEPFYVTVRAPARGGFRSFPRDAPGSRRNPRPCAVFWKPSAS